MKRFTLACVLVTLAALFVVGLVGCGGGDPEPDVPTPVTSCIAGRCL